MLKEGHRFKKLCKHSIPLKNQWDLGIKIAPEVLDHFYKHRPKCLLVKGSVLKLGSSVVDLQDKT